MDLHILHNSGLLDIFSYNHTIIQIPRSGTLFPMDLDALRSGFTYIRFERVDAEKNEQRYYSLACEATLIDKGAVVRRYGRLHGQAHVLAPEPFPSLEDAWPYIRSIMRRRLRNGYKIVGPDYVLRFLHLRPGPDFA